jgi:diguanylate cyclase (GGDEF)-like protein/PAS domain S-box-containing protein
MLNALILCTDAQHRDALARALAAEHANPMAFGTFEAALNQLRAASFALVFVPDHLPGWSGADLCGAVRSLPGGPATRIVALVDARDSTRSRRQLASDGFDDVLALPADEERVSVLVASVARAHYVRGASERERGWAQTLRRLALDLAWSTSIEQHALHALDAVRTGFAPLGAALWLRDRQQGDVRCLRSFGLSDAYPARAAAGFRLLSGNQWVALARQPDVLDDARAAGPLAALATDEGFATVATVALFTSSHVLGALVVYAADTRALTPDAIEWLETVAAQTAMGIDQIQLRAALGLRETTFQRLVEQTPDGVFAHDLRGNLLIASHAMADICGYQPDDLEQLNLADLFEPDDVARLRQLITALVDGEETTVVERATLVRADSRRSPVDITLCLLPPERPGDEPTIQGVLRDMRVVDRNQRELRALQRVSTVVATERDFDTALRGVTAVLRDELGYTRGGIWTLAPDAAALVSRAAFGLDVPTSVPLETGVIGRAARERLPVFARDVRGDVDYLNVDDAVTSQICVPILTDGQLLGVIDIEASTPQALEDEDVGFLTTLAAHLAGALERARLYEDVERRSRTDSVTGLANRGMFEQELRGAVSRAGDEPVSLLMAGLDNFKAINDTYGYAIGDELLRQVGAAMQARLGPGQLLARHTGDAFTVFLPGVERDAAVSVAEDLRIAVAMQLLTAAEQVEQVTVSIGVASYPDDATDGADELLAAADHALLLAKRAGKNQVFQSNAALADLAPAHGRITDLLRQSPTETLNLLVKAMDQRLPGRSGHSERVARHTLKIASELGVPDDELASLRLAALVHDIGMLALPDALLRKPMSLSATERQALRGVPLAAQQLLSELALPDAVMQGVTRHHERWNGSGYPDGLAGDDIPLAARIIAVADALDAMMSERAHRERLTLEQAIEQLRQDAGQQFDPAIVEAAAGLTRPSVGDTGPLISPFADLEPTEVSRVYSGHTTR